MFSSTPAPGIPNIPTPGSPATPATPAMPAVPAVPSDAPAQNLGPTVAIIGFGTAGVNAAIALRNAGYLGRIQAFSDVGERPYSPILTSYYAAGLKSYDECFPWSQDDINDLNVEFVPSSVDSLDVRTHTITTALGTYTYDKCVIATGASPSLDGFPAVAGYEPLVLRTMEDAERMRKALADPSRKRVLVAGSSMVALKTLEASLNQGKDTTLVGRGAHILRTSAVPEVAERIESNLRTQGATLRLGVVVESVSLASGPDTNRGHLAVTFSDGSTDYFDEICVAYGMKYNLDFLQPGALETDRALVVDEFMRTSNPDVYAAGDVAQALELISGEKRVVGIWKNAANQGACAGAAIAAELTSATPNTPFKGAIPNNTIAVNDALFLSAGTIEITANRRVEIREGNEMTVAYIFETTHNGSERLVGFNLACDHNEEGGIAYDTGAMLSLRIERDARR